MICELAIIHKSNVDKFSFSLPNYKLDILFLVVETELEILLSVVGTKLEILFLVVGNELEILFSVVEAELFALDLEDLAKLWRAAEEDGHAALPVLAHL